MVEIGAGGGPPNQDKTPTISNFQHQSNQEEATIVPRRNIVMDMNIDGVGNSAVTPSLTTRPDLNCSLARAMTVMAKVLQIVMLG